MSDKKRVKIRVRRGWIAYPGTPIQQGYGEGLEHGYLLWTLRSKNDHDVSFRELPNNRPYVTIDWKGDPDLTLAGLRLKPGSRIRVKSQGDMSLVDSQRLSLRLKEFEPCEVVFKDDLPSKTDFVVAFDGGKKLHREDLRHVGNLVELIREFHGEAAEDVDWKALSDLVAGYLSTSHLADDTLRNVRWSLKRVEFDNTFGFGEGNVVDISKMNGVVGILGQNTAGKSSFVGTILYGLFNATDRGSLKNLHVINTRKDFCRVKSFIDVDGVEYQVERQSTKVMSKKGAHAPTHLNVFRKEIDGSLTDLVGEDRKDTERVVRRLIGTVDDYSLTSMSPQGSIAQFIDQGSSRRLVYLSRFLDLDVFGKTYDLANRDANAIRSQLKSYASIDDTKIPSLLAEHDEMTKKLVDLKARKVTLGADIADVQARLIAFKSTSLVTRAHVTAQATVLNGTKDILVRLDDQSRVLFEEHGDLLIRSRKAKEFLDTQSIETWRRKHTNITNVERQIEAQRAQRKIEAAALKSLERSLQILDDVPCGDSFPTCKFIKDAHVAKPTISEKRASLASIDELIKTLEVSLSEMEDASTVESSIKKIEKVQSTLASYTEDITKKQAKIELIEHQKVDAREKIQRAQEKLDELTRAHERSDEERVINDTTLLKTLQTELKSVEDDIISLVSRSGKTQSTLERLESDIQERDKLNDRLRLLELISVAFARKGLPQRLLDERLPRINEEIAKILMNVVGFTVEMAIDPDSEDLEIYLNYGDSRRIIELGSGMEKMISSLAIRVALTNVSSLPRSDVLVIDEGFGVLDDEGVEACSRLLKSLNHYFRLVMFVTHVAGLKDVADYVISIARQEKDSKVVYVP